MSGALGRLFGGATAGGTAGASQPPSDTVSIVANGQTITGWQSVRIARGAERMPSSFDIAFTERDPTNASSIIIKPGDACTVTIGSDTVITGYVDRYMPSIAPNQHTVRLMGRGKCQDLVDCSAITHGMQVSGTSALNLAQQLAQPFGITVSSLSGAGPAIPQFNVTLGETPYEIIERVTRFAALLTYEGTDGNLILANVGATQMASGFELGVNVQEASASFSMDERYAVYVPAIMSVDSLSDLGSGNTPYPNVYDHAVRAGRQLVVVSEQSQNGVSIAQARAQWEATRRYGRSQAIRLTCDTWRDSAGALWAPNALANVTARALKIVNVTWVISEVVFGRDADRGTVADLVLMPKEAFALEPSVLQLYDWQIGQDLAATGGAGAAPVAPSGQRRDKG